MRHYKSYRSDIKHIFFWGTSSCIWVGRQVPTQWMNVLPPSSGLPCMIHQFLYCVSHTAIETTIEVPHSTISRLLHTRNVWGGNNNYLNGRLFLLKSIKYLLHLETASNINLDSGYQHIL